MSCALWETEEVGKSNEIVYSAVLQGEDWSERRGEDHFKKETENPVPGADK